MDEQPRSLGLEKRGKVSRKVAAFFSAATLLLGLAIGAGVTYAIMQTDATDTSTAAASATTTDAPATTRTSSAPVIPKPSDFVIGINVTGQQCFGSAGCNYRFRINPQYVGLTPLPDTLTVVYKVSGGDEDQIANFTIKSDGTATIDSESLVQGPAGAQLTAVATQVLEG
ncbi:hypothetical protein [uncultured Williamsia sp.]|uniref:hypothetical protein n=1 Tax=uncultured Williamsia sp. TaxID=259311 RepID=UPI0026124F1A|nr:hypothetical protein [uncultured Williamsia sp.]